MSGMDEEVMATVREAMHDVRMLAPTMPLIPPTWRKVTMDRRYHDAIHDAVVRVAEPGPEVAKMLDWCERYVDRELLTDSTDDRSLPPHQAARLAVEAYLRDSRIA